MSTAELRAALISRAPAFAALGDGKRLSIVAELATGEARSITALAAGTGITRQGVTKHLKVLEDAGIVRSRREGRETLFVLGGDALDDLSAHLALVARQWDEALARLRTFVEE